MYEESLVTSTNEFIKNILIKVYDTHKIKFKDKIHEGHDLILKADGFREYFEGNYQLLQYERVRVCLRKKINMKLILTQIPKNYRSKFPPLFKQLHEYDNRYSKASTSQNSKHTAHLDDNFNFAAWSKDSQPYFWFSPVPNLKHKFQQQ